MEVQSSPVNSVIPKRLWNFLRIVLFMVRKGLISKRKLIIDMNLMMKRGILLGKTLGNLMFHHHHPSRNGTYGGFGIQEYEFSCSNTPNPVFFHLTTKRKYHYFPCINPPHDPEEPNSVIVLPKIEYSPDYSYSFRFDTADLGLGEKRSPLLSPFSVRVSNYSSDDENGGGDRQVDDDAEEFIRRFYEQLRVQSRTQLLHYQEIQCQEMLARGTR